VPSDMIVLAITMAMLSRLFPKNCLSGAKSSARQLFKCQDHGIGKFPGDNSNQGPFKCLFAETMLVCLCTIVRYGAL
jgi:hypothetical protein